MWTKWENNEETSHAEVLQVQYLQLLEASIFIHNIQHFTLQLVKAILERKNLEVKCAVHLNSWTVFKCTWFCSVLIFCSPTASFSPVLLFPSILSTSIIRISRFLQNFLSEETSESYCKGIIVIPYVESCASGEFGTVCEL